jgi:hypothetical protein
MPLSPDGFIRSVTAAHGHTSGSLVTVQKANEIYQIPLHSLISSTSLATQAYTKAPVSTGTALEKECGLVSGGVGSSRIPDELFTESLQTAFVTQYPVQGLGQLITLCFQRSGLYCNQWPSRKAILIACVYSAARLRLLHRWTNYDCHRN